MKYRHYILINKALLPTTAYEKLCEIAPYARTCTPFGFHLQLDSEFPDGGEVVRRITELCAANGLKNYSHTALRWYGDDFLRGAAFFVLQRQRKVQGLTNPERDEQGRLILLARNAKRRLKVGRLYPNHIIVSDIVRRTLQSGQFVGLQFGEVVLTGKSALASSEPFWELQSNIVLPKMANTEQFIHPGRAEAESFAGDYSKTILIHDPPFNKGVVHYRRHELAKVQPFDIARTFENYMEPHPALVVSQRFYQHCLKNDISLYVDPICINSQ